ncbi:MAG TPA: hypothetical protein VGN26_20460 [Armatimonadota bacterium]|jgi:hypothetical protein
MFTPAISPLDPKLMMVNCDMSAAYVSVDGGGHWRMINQSQLRSSTQCRPAFHPTEPATIYAASGWDGLKVSRNRGATWTALGPLPDSPQGEISLNPSSPGVLLVGCGDGVARSNDAGAKWSRCSGPTGTVLGFHWDRSRLGATGTCFAGTTQGVWRTDDSGATWAKSTQGLPAGELLAFAGGSRPATGALLYCSLPRTLVDGKLEGGIYRSTNLGATWEKAGDAGLNNDTKAFDEWAQGPIAQYGRLLTSDAASSTVYAFNTNTGVPPPHHASAYVSHDAGRTWRPTFQADPRFPGFNVEADYTVASDGQFYQEMPLGVAGDPNNPEVVLTTDSGRVYLTRDGGKSWRPIHTLRVPGPQPTAGPATRWVCNGLVVTTTWNHYVDPFDAARQYICYTDIGFARSPDGGNTWQWWAEKGRAPWRNTCYELAFDPQTRGKVWGAFSNVHDIPNGNIILGRHNSQGPGGVCLSLDFGATWTALGGGLPSAPCTSVVVDRRSAQGSRTLYAGFFGKGVYRSTDDGRTWVEANQGLGSAGNLRVCRVFVHLDGTLFALVTALRSGGQFTTSGVGLYRSTDGAKSWQLANGSQPLLWPKDFTVSPRDSKVILLSACDANGKEQGGLYRTTDGGATWKRIGRQGPEHFGGYLHPDHPDWIYMTLTEGAPGPGLWLSKNLGESWVPAADFPFSNAQRVSVDPRNHELIYVTTFGGSVWCGPADFNQEVGRSRATRRDDRGGRLGR